MRSVFIRKRVSPSAMAAFSIVMFAALLSGCSGCKSPLKGTSDNPVAAKNGVVEASFKDLSGKDVKLAEAAAGKPFMLVFFADWCPVCKQEIPGNNDIFKKYFPRGLVMFGVNVGDTKEKVEEIINKYGIQYPVLLDAEGTSNKLFGLPGLPMIFIYDRQGNLVYKNTAPPGEDELDKLVSKKDSQESPAGKPPASATPAPAAEPAGKQENDKDKEKDKKLLESPGTESGGERTKGAGGSQQGTI